MPEVASALANGAVVGWLNGRMEFGPRALGARSILGDARSPKMQSVMNFKIKNRESFRPFAPAIAADAATHWFNTDYDSPYMLKVATVKDEHRIAMSDEEKGDRGFNGNSLPTKRPPEIRIFTPEQQAKLDQLSQEIAHSLPKDIQQKFNELDANQSKFARELKKAKKGKKAHWKKKLAELNPNISN